MNDVLLAAAGFILLTVAAGLVRVLRGPGDFDRMMAVQLLGTGGIASLLLIASATTVAGVEDVALGLALLAAFASVAFVNSAATEAPESPEAGGAMSLALDLFSLAAIGAGAFFFFAGTVGLLRFPDSLTRLHALTKADNLGLGLVVLGLLPRAGSLLDALRLIAIWALVQLSGAATAQLIGRALSRRGAAELTVLPVLDLGLAILVVAVAAWTIAARELFAAVVGYVAYGLLLSIVWIRLYAPDVALTEAAIGSGVTGVLLVTVGRAARRRRRKAEAPSCRRRCSGSRPPLSSVLVAAALAAVVLMLAEPAPTLAPEARQGLAATGLGNPVTAVLIAYRSFDTMLEKVVLVLAVVGVWSVAPDRFWGGAPAPLGRARPEGALVFLDQILAPLGILVGIQMFWVGADEPGGAFQGGAILAAMWMIVMMARLAEPPRVGARWLRLALIAGPAVFLVAGLAGPAWPAASSPIPPASPSRSSCSSRRSWCCRSR